MTSIYSHKTSDGMWVAFLIIGGFSIFFSAADLAGAAFILDEPNYYWYSFLFRVPIIVIYSIMSTKAHYFYRYFSLALWLAGIPTFFWSVLIFAKTMPLWLFVLTLIMYVFIAWLFVDNALNKKFDYTKAAKQLIKDYPEPIVVNSNSVLDDYEKLNQEDGGVGSKIMATIFSVVPPWSIYAFPFIFVNIASQFMGLNGLAIMIASSILFFYIMIAGYLTFRWRYKEVFERAEELLAENKFTSKK